MIHCGLNYIKQRYGTPTAAWQSVIVPPPLEWIPLGYVVDPDPTTTVHTLEGGAQLTVKVVS